MADLNTSRNILKQRQLQMLLDHDAQIRSMRVPNTRTEAGIVASTTQTQGQRPLTRRVNEIATCANPNDTVTLPSAGAGKEIIIINNGAQTLKIYPASGDNLGAGVDASTTLAAGSNRRYVAYNDTNWEIV